MYNAFINRGYEVILINGNVQERRKSSFIVKNNYLENIDYCYIEPSTYPCHPIDYLMFIYIKSPNIPVGYFTEICTINFRSYLTKKELRRWNYL